MIPWPRRRLAGLHSAGRQRSLLSWLVLASLSLVGIAAAQTPEAPTAESAAHAAGSSHLRGGWYPWDPYQYREYRHGVSILTGFDVEIERALARIMRVEISLPPITWEGHLAALADGRADIASGATASEERSAFAYVSKPYRTETDVLILPKGAGRRYPFRTVEQMLDTFAKQRFRLGVIAGARMPMRASTPSLPIRPTGTRSLPSPATPTTCRICSTGDRRFSRRSRCGEHHGLAQQASRPHRRASAALLGRHSFSSERTTQTPQMLARLDAGDR